MRVRRRCSSFSQTTNGIPLASLPSHLLTAEVRMAPSIPACVHTPAAWKGSVVRSGSKAILHHAPRRCRPLSLAYQAGSACVETGLQPLTVLTLYEEPIIVLISWATPRGGQTGVNTEHRGRILNSRHTAVSLPGWGWGWPCLNTFQNHSVKHKIKLWSTLERRAGSYSSWEEGSGPLRDRLTGGKEDAGFPGGKRSEPQGQAENVTGGQLSVVGDTAVHIVVVWLP